MKPQHFRAIALLSAAAFILVILFSSFSAPPATKTVDKAKNAMIQSGIAESVVAPVHLPATVTPLFAADHFHSLIPFQYLVRKPRTKVSEITTRMLHKNPGYRNS